MTFQVPVKEQLDPNAVEARTQAIGRELFARATQAHAHLSVLNRWTAKVLSWCLTDPTLKGSVLRFIDVLPGLKSPRAITRHLREYFPSHDLRLPPALRLSATLARPGLLTAPAVSTVTRQVMEQVARQFIAESRPEGASQLVRHLASHGVMCSFDLLGEQVLSESEADRYVQQCQDLLREVARAYADLSLSTPRCGPRVNFSIKPSALTPRFDPISPSDSIERAIRRLLPLLSLADQHQALIHLDMEQYALRDLTLALSQQLLEHPKIHGRVKLGVVLQTYLRDADTVAEELLGWLASHEQHLTIRLVKGAYWDYEVAQGIQTRRPVPVYQHKAETDLVFERLTRRLLGAHPLVTTAIASHNVRSIAHAMAVAEAYGLSKEHLEFQLLYGMGEALGQAIVSLGYPVRVYTPIGELLPGMAYLVRRLLENTANESFLRQEFLRERSAEELLRPPEVSLDRQEPAAGAASGPVAWSGGEAFTDFSQAQARDRMAQALTEVRGQLGRSYAPLLGDGTGGQGDVLVARNPSNPLEVVGEITLAGISEVDRAVALADAAQPRWARTPLSERVACLRRAAGLMRARRFELAAWEILEVGKTWREADADVVEAIDALEYYSHSMESLAQGKPLPQVPGERNAYRYVPRGVAVVIAPWNFPAAILTGMASAALAAGNVVIVKPAEQSSVMAALVVQILRQAGVPPGVVQYLPGWGHEVGAALVRHPGTRTILFTGSKAVGLSIVQACGYVGAGQRFVKHVITEMGGKNALIVDEDADLDAAVHGTLVSAFGYAGQKCSAASRAIVHETVYDRFLERLIQATDRLVIGDPSDPATDVGPLVEEAAQRRLQEALTQAGETATVTYTAPAARIPPQGYFVGPTIVTELAPQHPLAREELFGPLLCVFRVRSFDEALALANDTEYALTGGVYSRSPSHIERAIQAFDVGNLYVNRQMTGAIVGRQPFGGHRLSGLGTKAGGPDYLLQVLLPKTVCVNTARHGMPLE